MVLFNKSGETKEENNIGESITITEEDKLITYIKKSDSVIKNDLNNIIRYYFISSIHDYKKCKGFIDFCIKHGNRLNIMNFTKEDILKKIYYLIMNFENDDIMYNLINLVIDSDKLLEYLNYMNETRSYFIDLETYAARIYEVVNHDIDIKTALKEDKIRLGIYDNINAENLYNLNKRLESIKNQVDSFECGVSDSKTKLEQLKEGIKKLSDHSVENIENSSNMSIKEIQEFTNDSIKKIERILSVNPSSKKEILIELGKEFDTIDAFDKNVPIKERYEKLLSLKDKTIYYHPKFNEVLK